MIEKIRDIATDRREVSIKRGMTNSTDIMDIDEAIEERNRRGSLIPDDNNELGGGPSLSTVFANSQIGSLAAIRTGQACDAVT